MGDPNRLYREDTRLSQIFLVADSIIGSLRVRLPTRQNLPCDFQFSFLCDRLLDNTLATISLPCILFLAPKKDRSIYRPCDSFF